MLIAAVNATTFAAGVVAVKRLARARHVMDADRRALLVVLIAIGVRAIAGVPHWLGWHLGHWPILISWLGVLAAIVWVITSTDSDGTRRA